jgi:HemY protein
MLFRLILLLILSGIVAYATLWLVANPGYVNIDWMGWQIETTMQVLLIFLLAFFLLIAIVSALYRFVFSLGKIRSHAQLAKRVKDQEQGLNVLIKALKAASDGEAHEGRRMTSEAAQLLQRSELTKLLAPFMPLPPTEMKGNRKLLEEVPARPAKGRLAAPETGSKLTKEPVAETPEVMALDVSKLTDLMRAKDWDGAEQLVNLAYPPQGKPPKAKSRLSDCLLLAKAMTAADMPIKDNLDHSLVLAKAAMRHESAVLVPASILAADLLVRQGHTDEAITILRDTWSKHPAYPLLARYVQLMCEETPEVQLANIEAVIQGRH